ncbi:MAG: sulfite exporter TauE/SafE family protein [Cytophagales bacterium]|jgi:hypothetical protein|nr:sulfite exporter TauE/SafE family protein [Cytophagales bacterium]
MYIAFVTGLVSSLHCLGMCGPIALALPARNRLNAVLYNLGRISTYAALGALFGLFGRGLYLAGLQQYLSVAAGVCILLVLLVPRMRLPFMERFTVWIRQKFTPFFRQKNAFGMYMIGVLNGLLPCGMVYVALVGAVAMSGLGEGAAYMALFGLGTLPMMLAVSFSKKLIKPRFKLQINRLMPVLALCIGALFIVRGLNLGIPGLSPKVEAQTKTMSCCKKK